MSRSPRFREREIPASASVGRNNGYYTWPINDIGGPVNRIFETCSDTIGPVSEDGQLDLYKLEGEPPRFTTNGWIGGPAFYWTDFKSWVPPQFATQDPRTIGLALPDFWDLALRARANVNPNRPDVDLPLFLWELKDIPLGVKQAGELLDGGININSVAGNNLAVNFGWLPLINDLRKLLDLQDELVKRMRYLEKLAKGAPFRVRRSLGSKRHPLSQSATVWYYSYGPVGIRGYTTVEGSEKYWFTTKVSSTWRPTIDYNLRRGAFDTALGLRNASMATVWNMIPWSWLIDWFSNVGKVLTAYRSGIPFQVEAFNIMAQARAEYRFHPVSISPGVTQVTPSSRTWTRKLRRVVVPSPFPQFNLSPLTAKQWGILGSLVATRGRTSHSNR